ncbi:WD40-repeat-containing domain protein [Cantharellus anzutake]|uniref:WD40-repeat-containing domain protein n=1 Tax=Cantharellus anzutake TaxID=1750568 RepID=UPI001908C1F8|nr:WD40-repeat-containing domain protein [Cantharellus anzutake]KAF8336580.1 WD40-repeat-containing domain protein [Cantharellus anzutake]
MMPAQVEQGPGGFMPLTPATDKQKGPSRPKLRRFITRFGSGSLSGKNKATLAPRAGDVPSHRRSQTVDAHMNTEQMNMSHGPPPGSRLSDPFSLIEIMDARSRSSPLWIPPFRRVAIPRPAEPKKMSLLPRLLQAMSPSPSKRNKDMVTWPEYDDDGYPFPLDGEEGELVEDEGCYESDIIRTAALLAIPLPTRMDILYLLPPEISLDILTYLDLRSILAVTLVSKYWHFLATDRFVWRGLFKKQTRWGLKGLPMGDPLSPPIPCEVKGLRFHKPSIVSRTNRPSLVSYRSNEGKCPPSCLDLSVDWKYLYRTRVELDRRWNKMEPKVTRLAGHTDSVYCLELSSTSIITGSRDKQILVWSLRSGKQSGVLRGHEGSVLCLKYDSRSALLVSGSSDRRVLVWDLSTICVGGQAETPDEGVAVVRPKRTLTGHTGGVLDVKMNDEFIISCSKDTTIRVYSKQTFEHLHTLAGHTGPVNALGLSGNHLVSASGDGTLILWSLPLISSPASNSDCAPSRLRTLSGHTRGLACVDFHGDIVISGSSDMCIKIWSAKSGECLTTFKGHDALVRSLEYDPLMGRLVSASYDRKVIVWDVKVDWVELGNGGGNAKDLEADIQVKKVREYSGYHSRYIFDVKFDASRIVSSSHDRKINIMDFGTNLDVSLFL